MRILITGSTGMVGKNLLNHSKINQHQILAPSSQELNLLDYSQTISFLLQNPADLIIHCAGLVGGIQANLKDPVGFLNQNLLMGINLVNASYQANITKLINLGSSCMYPRDYLNPLKEEYLLKAPLEPSNEGYALAKITVAKLCEYISKQFKINYKTLIPCNIFGLYDKFDENTAHLVPSAIRKIHYAKLNSLDLVDVWGDGISRREFMYAGDLADGILFAMENLTKLPAYTNLGLGYDYSINEYYQIIAEVIGYQGGFWHDLSRPVGMTQKLVDISKMSNLGWKAKTSLEEGIKKTYQFFQGL